jgi:hypothetical protein
MIKPLDMQNPKIVGTIIFFWMNKIHYYLDLHTNDMSNQILYHSDDLDLEVRTNILEQGIKMTALY